MIRKCCFVLFATLILVTALGNVSHSSAISFTTKSLKLNESTSYEIVQISEGLGSIQAKANTTLEQSITEWVQSDYLWIANSEWNVVFQSKEYLTVCYSVNLNEGDATARFFQTVDLSDGSRVFLNDFISNEQTFVSKFREALPNFTDDELITIYQYASLSENDFLNLMAKDDPLAKAFALSYLKEKPDFYLSSRGIALKMSPYTDDDILICVDGHIEYSGRTG